MKRCVPRHKVTQPLDASYRLIPLTQGQNAIVDVGDFEWLSQWNWLAMWAHGARSFYAERNRTPDLDCRYMHRLILGCSPGELGDHINCNSLDNRRCNLRKCTGTENRQNRRINRNNTSGYRGVAYSKEQRKWVAYLRGSTERIFLGYFETPEAAALARDDAARIHFGIYAKLNFPHISS